MGLVAALNDRRSDAPLLWQISLVLAVVGVVLDSLLLLAASSAHGHAFISFVSEPITRWRAARGLGTSYSEYV